MVKKYKHYKKYCKITIYKISIPIYKTIHMNPQKALLKLKIHMYWTAFLQEIQRSLSHEYYYYKTGEIPYSKLIEVLTKLNDYYRLDETPGERFNRYKAGFSVVVMHMLYMKDSIKFVLMCRANETKTGLFFEREKYADARVKKNRITLNNCYELARVNKTVYNPTTKVKKTDNEVWTADLTDTEKERIYTIFNTALLKRDYKQLKQVCYGLHHLIGFAGVRETYQELKYKLEKRFTKFMQSQSWSKYKVLSDLYKLPVKIGYIKRIEAHVIDVEEVLFMQRIRAGILADGEKLKTKLKELDS